MWKKSGGGPLYIGSIEDKVGICALKPYNVFGCFRIHLAINLPLLKGKVGIHLATNLPLLDLSSFSTGFFFFLVPSAIGLGHLGQHSCLADKGIRKSNEPIC